MKTKPKKLEEEYCFHRNFIIAGGLIGCPDCGAGGEKFEDLGTKMKPRREDPLVSKINEVIDYLK